MSWIRNFLSGLNKNHGNVNGADLEDHVTTPLTKTVEEVDVLKPLHEEDQFFVEWKEVNCFVSTVIRRKNPVLESIKKFTPFVSSNLSNKETPISKKQILYSVNGKAVPGEILALLGPSGSGKTTLLSAIGGRVPSAMTLSGLITYNRAAFDRSTKNLVGYVAQEDVLYGNLTVYETLYYVALLKLPKTMSREEKTRRVEAVIDALGLNKCRDTLIGTPFRRGVSGGERKRVSVGHELLTNPSVLILDEPTSGLDAAMAMHLFVSLRSLSDSRRVVIMSIHQPSSRLFHQLQKLILLADGKVLYFGDSQKASEWFEQKGFPTPDGIHIADFILDIANGDVEGHGMDKQASLRYLLNSALRDTSVIDEEASRGGSGMRKMLSERTLKRSMTQRGFLGRTDRTEDYGAYFCEQISLLLSRATRVRRLDSFGFHCVLYTVAMAIMTSAIFWKSGTGNTIFSAEHLACIIVFFTVQVQFDVTYRAVFSIRTVMPLLVKERAGGMYKFLAFYIAESLCDIPLDCSLPMIFVTAAYWSGGCRQSVGAFLLTVVSMIPTALVSQTLGSFLGTTISDERLAFSIATVTLLTFLLVNGFFVKYLPKSVSWMRYVSSSYWCYYATLQIQFNDKPFYDCSQMSEVQDLTEECPLVEDLGNALDLPMDFDKPLWIPLAVLFGMFVVMKVVVYCILQYKSASQH